MAMKNIQIDLDEIKDLPDGDYAAGDWEVSVDTEGGQPNGIGEIEESGYREWFRDERENHHRRTITLYGPWLPGARPHIAERQRRDAEQAVRAVAYQEERILQQAAEIMERRREAERDAAKDAIAAERGAATAEVAASVIADQHNINVAQRQPGGL